ncbi:SusC/RagA family TonB-linked outer membrane protein [Belliella marina]|uniref:SusC/RagA family TonB-linked outer membrane protein n=2 Tax=Belliella marina TaxID=1644146 RepID=A0ABW4VKT1_9BACT
MTTVLLPSYARDARGDVAVGFSDSTATASMSVPGELSHGETKLDIAQARVDKSIVNQTEIKKAGQGVDLFNVLDELAAKNDFAYNVNGIKKPSKPSLDKANAIKLAQITGIVTDAKDGLPIPGVTVLIKGTTKGVATDLDGQFRINVEPGESLIFSFIGYKSREIAITDGRTTYNISLSEDETSLEEIVVVGYSEQKKETVVGAVVSARGEELQRTGGVSSVGAALTGALPGLITTAGTGVPGADQPQIVIRGQNSWNGNSPLILVDGVERPEFFNQMDIGSVESITVLKDASATAQFGSRGANGVIIVITKRGRDGRAEVSARVSSAAKVVSMLPGKFDSYDAIGVRNMAIERELGVNPNAWSQIIPQEMRNLYRYPTSLEDAERYPNVDWQRTLFRDVAMAHNANVSIRGGTPRTKYFASIDYQNEGDQFRGLSNNDRGYQAGFDFNRFNFRSNLDFQLTKSTVLKVDLGGTYAARKTPFLAGDNNAYWSSAYNNAPDAFMPIYSNGFYGFVGEGSSGATNSYSALAHNGIEYITTANLMSNFILEQDLGMLIPGLKFRGNLSVDNRFTEVGRGVDDRFREPRAMFIDPFTGQVSYFREFDTNSNFDYFPERWNTTVGNIGTNNFNGPQRRLFYQARLNYNKTIADDHNISILGQVQRQEDAIGSMIPVYREDWVFHTSYNYKGKYLIDYSGAYNGSEKFSPENRFAFFSAGGIGWVISEENFLKSFSSIDFLKIRATYGEVGDDSAGGRFLFMNQWAFGGAARMGLVGDPPANSPYQWYRETVIGNPSVKWETVYKYNIATEFSFFEGKLYGELDFFRDNRVDVLMTSGRAVPSYYGASAPAANLGEVMTQGFELQLGTERKFSSGLRLWADIAVTHATDQVIFRDDPELLPAYQKQAGFQLGQTRSHITNGFVGSWDEVYAQTQFNAENQSRIPGMYQIVDFNGDGIIDAFDSAPYGYSGVPMNTYNTNIGAEYKGWSLFLQFYAVNNVTRSVPLMSLTNQRNLVFEQGSLWSPDNLSADTAFPRWLPSAGYHMGNRFQFDASYIRLKNAEIAYQFQPNQVKKLGLANLRVFLNGNNLLMWTQMPDDRESNAGGGGGTGAYPLVRRFNLGLNMTF